MYDSRSRWHLCVESLSLSLLNPLMWNTEVSMQIIKYFLNAMLHRPPALVYKWSLNHNYLVGKSKKLRKNLVTTTLIRAKRVFCLNWPLGNW